MSNLATLEQVNLALKLDLEGTSPDYAADPRTPDINLKIAQASDIVLDYINREPEGTDEDPAWDATTAPGRVNAATIIIVRCLLDDSEESLAILTGLAGAGLAPADISNPVVAMLYRLRDPALA